MAIISKTYGRLLAILLSWIGFLAIPVSCGAYGTPPGTYKAKGTVVSQTGDVPIEGIRAVFKSHPNAEWGIDTAYTNHKGAFYLKSSEGYNMMYVELTDVDGEKNGLFTSKEIVIDFSHVQFKSTDWEDREVEKDLGIIKLESKE